MKKTFKVSALLLAFVMLIALASCTREEAAHDMWSDAIYTEDTVLGEGSKTVEVEIGAEDKSITVTLKTDADDLADALKEHSLIEGEESQYGIYIKKVNGMTADYDIDGYYWSLTKNGEYLMSGADGTEIADGEHYELVRTK